MPFTYRKTLFITLLLFFSSLNIIHAQQSQDQFGKNRVQFKQFKWEYYSTINFDIYYYEGAKDLARTVGNFAELDFQHVTSKTGFTPYSKIKILVYNSVSDLQQSNIGLDLGHYVTGGQTQFVKSKIEIAFKGSEAELRKELSFAFAQMLINIMLYGGSLKDIVQSSYLLSLPDWYVNGAAAYISEGWSSEMDNYMRDRMLKGHFKKPRVLTGKDAMISGQSIWNYIAQKYGEENIANILNLTRVVREETACIESTLGVPFGQFIKDWREYYLSMAAELSNSYVELPKENRVIKNRKGSSIHNVSASPDGTKISFIKSFKGKYSLNVYQVIKGKNKVIHRGGSRLLNQEEDPNVIVCGWKSSDQLVYSENRKNKFTLNLIDFKTGKKSKRVLNEFNQIISFSFSSDGEKMLLSADKSGQSDLFIYDWDNNSIQQLTNDLYDDFDPIFLNDNSTIAFSSNRVSDTIKKEATISYKTIQPEFNIFILPLKSKKSILKRVSFYGNNSHPFLLNNSDLFYLSDEKGILNLYKYNLTLEQTTQVTNYIRNVSEVALSNSSTVGFKSLYKSKEYVYVVKDFNFKNEASPRITTRQMEYEKTHPRNEVENTTNEEDDEFDININDYKFESDRKKQNSDSAKGKSLFFTSSSKINKKDEINIKGPYKYMNTFGVERVNASFMIDPLRGTGMLLEGDMSDLMGNHRMNAGLFGLFDLKSNSVFGEYLYLKRKVDFKLRFDRKVIFRGNELATHRYSLNKFAATASYPLSTSSRVSVSPFFAGTRFTDMSGNNTSYLNPDVFNYYTGLQGQYVFDNTVVTGLNMIEGTRAKVSIEQYLSTSSSNKDFGKLVMDVRHYHRIHRDLVFATRASYGQFFGKSAKRFLLGGMDNWLFNSTHIASSTDPLALTPFVDNSNLLFVEYVTNMRGFNYNYQNGTKYLLFNGELRWPIVKYFYRGVLNSNFLKNLQLVAFTDIGAAWTGKLFGTDNSTNTTTIGGGSIPFTATVINYKSPFLVGYGAGVRTLFLGYYIKFDAAWGMIDQRVVSKKLYLTFGFDF
jgi:Tol biopolymer transport system component